MTEHKETIHLRHTPRGFSIGDFRDRNGISCSIQKSSLAFEDALWLGCDDADPRACVPNLGWQPVPLPENTVCNTRMHLTQAHVGELLPLLIHFYLTGELATEPLDYKLTFEKIADTCDLKALLETPVHEDEDEEL